MRKTALTLLLILAPVKYNSGGVQVAIADAIDKAKLIPEKIDAPCT